MTDLDWFWREMTEKYGGRLGWSRKKRGKTREDGMRENYSRACAENGKFPSCKPPVLHLLNCSHLCTTWFKMLPQAIESVLLNPCLTECLPSVHSAIVLCVTYCAWRSVFCRPLGAYQINFVLLPCSWSPFRRGSLRALPNRSRSVDPAHLHRARQERSGEYLWLSHEMA